MDVSVVILSYNVAPLLKDCIDSIFKYTKDIGFEIIVVDNASTDDSAEVAKSFGSKIKFIQAKENLGFAKGNNLAIKQVKGKYILVLNPDTLFLENSLYRMFYWIDTHPDVAVVSCQLVDSEQKISPTGGYFPTLSRVVLWAFFLDDLPLFSQFINSYHPKDADSRYAQEFFPDWVTGAFFLIRQTVLKKIGSLDENIFMYGEELEWCLRAKRAGYQVGYTPITKIVHLERRSSAGGSENAVLGEFKGLKYIYQKYYSPTHQYLLDLILVLAAFARVVMWLVRLKPKIARIYLKAMVL